MPPAGDLGSRLPSPPWTTRFAPAPTGLLHLGHAANAVFVWGIARAFGGRIVLRIEDHDRIRCRPEYEGALLDDLDWLGLAPDLGATAELRAGPSPCRQSDRLPLYEAALARLEAAGLVYPCACSRRAIRDGSPQGATELRYPGTCRARGLDPDLHPMRRVRLDPRAIAFDDLLLGPQRQLPAEECGDLLARDRDGNWTYQFAVVVDDLDQGIDVVIRGVDLLPSTGRQVQLAALLGRREPPRFLHHPLLLRSDGTKLSKANRDTGLADLRAAGWGRERVLGEAAFLAGLQARASPLAPEGLPALFL
ncbi:MAG TPA: glutamate--tRNA ligase family protein [Thermoanaerobaculia bacterium]|nr:glutamate--tRNA ligase family protein [Thermoanaerobaculia bacterium]